jgi:hypothetical protein
MDPISLLYVVVACIVGLLAVLVLLAFANRHRLRRKANVPDELRLSLQAALLEAIKTKSANQRTSVNIRRFWRGTGLKAYQRNAVIDPLIESGDVFVDHRVSGSEIWDVAVSWWNLALYRPPAHLVLSDRTWTRMVHEGVSGQSIVIGTFVERTQEVNDFSINTGGGDNIGSPVGRSVRVGDVEVTKSSESSGVSTELLAELVSALRTDAVQLDDPAVRASVRSLADKLEDEGNAQEPDEDKIDGMLSRARRYANSSAGLMGASHKVLEAWEQLKGQ